MGEQVCEQRWRVKLKEAFYQETEIIKKNKINNFQVWEP